MRLAKKLFLPALVGALALGACDDLSTGIDDGPSGQLSGSDARMSILLTDAPGDLQAAVVTITDIYLQGDSGRVYLMRDSSVTTNLLTLSDSVMGLVNSKPIPSGSYSQLRFVISGAYVKTEKAGGGSTYYATSGYSLPAGVVSSGELKCPSCSKSGIKVILGGDDGVRISSGAAQTVLVDFDVSESFLKPAGNSGKWMMRPTLKGTVTSGTTAATGTAVVTLAKPAALTLPAIGGTATTLGSFKVTATPSGGGEAKTSTFTDANNDGTFETSFTNLTAGTYSLAIVGPTGLTFTTTPATPQTITVTAGGSVTTAFSLVTATAP